MRIELDEVETRSRALFYPRDRLILLRLRSGSCFPVSRSAYRTPLPCSLVYRRTIHDHVGVPLRGTAPGLSFWDNTPTRIPAAIALPFPDLARSPSASQPSSKFMFTLPTCFSIYDCDKSIFMCHSCFRFPPHSYTTLQPCNNFPTAHVPRSHICEKYYLGPVSSFLLCTTALSLGSTFRLVLPISAIKSRMFVSL